MGYRKVTEQVVKVRLCNDCRKPIVGLTERGLTTWLDVFPCSPEVEVILQRAGRNTYHVQPRPNRAYWVDWRSAHTGGSVPSRGFVLAEHAHQSPSNTKAPDPPWVLDQMTKPAPATKEGYLF